MITKLILTCGLLVIILSLSGLGSNNKKPYMYTAGTIVAIMFICLIIKIWTS